MKKSRFYALTLILPAVIGCSGQTEKQDADFMLTDGWKIQSSAVVGMTGEDLSSGQTPDQVLWYNAHVPSTVLGTLTENGLFQDAFTGTNYGKSLNRDDFEPAWWYIKEFEMPKLKPGQHAVIHFEGISYSAEVWLNGKKLASRDAVTGPFKQFGFDVTELVSGKNTLAVEVFRAEDGDFNIGFVDWNPKPADESMGIFRPVWIRYSNAVSISNPAVRSKVNTETLDEAWLTVETTLENISSAPVEGELILEMEGKRHRLPVVLGAKEKKIVSVDAEDAEMLHVRNPRLWWCHNLGSPEMYRMDISFETDGRESDTRTVNFGIRQIESYMTDEGYRGFMLNGKKVLVKGAGWTDDIFLRNPDERNEIELDYVKDMNLNTVRFENVWGTSQNVYDLCDQKGLLALVGWSCFWEWEVYSRTPNDEYGCIKTEEDMELIDESFRDQILWLRNHPSIIAWYAGSDMLPRPELEKRYLKTLSEIDDRPYVASAKALVSELSGPTGMKMVGPYDYVAPSYWYSPQAPGGAFGFNTETGIGAQLPEMESIKKMIPAEELWPMGAAYDYHCTTSASAMNSLDVLKDVVNKRYGPSSSLDEFLIKAQHLDYDGTRAMFEGFRANVPRSTGVIQWMLNSAWPKLYWQLYDWYLVPGSGYWSVKKACAPQQLVFNYGDRHVYAVNDEAETCHLSAHAVVYDLSGRKLTELDAPAAIPEGSSVRLFDIPRTEEIAFMFLSLKDNSGNEVADNVYCLAPTDDVHDWARSDWVRTPLQKSADYTSLANLEKAQIGISANQKGATLEVTLSNKSDVVAFFVRMAVKNGANELVVPVFWSDNRISLKPGESRIYTCDMSHSAEDASTLEVSGWNVPVISIPLQ